jgi:glycerol-3-phosphate cytidylyltransferase
LVVGVSTDEFNAEKGKTSVMPYPHRAEIVRAIRQVAGVFPECSWAQKRADIKREGADIFAMGDDWVGKFDDLSDICDVVYLPRTRDISSTDLRQLLQSMQQDRVQELRRATEHVLQLVSEL